MRKTGRVKLTQADLDNKRITATLGRALRHGGLPRSAGTPWAREMERQAAKEQRDRQQAAEDLVRKGEQERSDLIEQERQAKLEHIAAVLRDASERAKASEPRPQRYVKKTERVPVQGMSGVPQSYRLVETYHPIGDDDAEGTS